MSFIDDKINSTTVESLTSLCHTVGNKLFPNRTDTSMYLKMYEEIGEIIKSDGDEEEVADAFIMLFDYAARKNINVVKAVTKKLELNLTRLWKQNENGVFYHVKR